MSDTPRILIVDDDHHVRESLLDELQPIYEVDAATCGDEAIPLLERNRYDAVVSDFRMPGHDGVWVLDNVRRLQPHAARILLTGHLDERAREATIEPEAPYKVGKPWHDTLDVTLRRALEAQRRKNGFDHSFRALLDLARHDEDLAAADGPQAVAELLLTKARLLPGLISVELRVCGQNGVERTCGIKGDPEAGETVGEEWELRGTLPGAEPIEIDAKGTGDHSRETLELLLERTRHWLGQNPLSKLARRAAVEPDARERLMGVARRATVGQMAASMMHELASIVQAMQFSMADIVARANDVCPGEDLNHDLSTVTKSSHRIVTLFSAMRRFVRSGDAALMQCRLDAILADSITLCRHYLPAGCQARIEPTDESVVGNRPLLTQVFVNLLRNAADVTRPGGIIDVRVRVENDENLVSVIDDGPGVAAELVPRLFEPFITDKGPDRGSGLGLAFSADVVRAHDGRIEYGRAQGRGACFTVALPQASLEDG